MIDREGQCEERERERGLGERERLIKKEGGRKKAREREAERGGEKEREKRKESERKTEGKMDRKVG